jgi:hypothetical protein
MHNMLCIDYSHELTTMARTTISIADDLKKRMDRVKEPVNWSAIASEAFELKLGDIARKKEVKTMDTVIERLRASKIRRASDMEREGREVGIEWAKCSAEYDQLERVADANPNELFAGPDEPGAYAVSLAFVIGGLESDASHDEIWEAWDAIVTDVRDPRLNSEEFLRGFMEGAEEVFREVAGKV